MALTTTTSNPTSVHLTAIADDTTLSELWRLGLYIDALPTDIVHQTYEAETVVEYAYTRPASRTLLRGRKPGTLSDVFDEVMSLQAEDNGKAASKRRTTYASWSQLSLSNRTKQGDHTLVGL